MPTVHCKGFVCVRLLFRQWLRRPAGLGPSALPTCKPEAAGSGRPAATITRSSPASRLELHLLQPRSCRRSGLRPQPSSLLTPPAPEPRPASPSVTPEPAVSVHRASSAMTLHLWVFPGTACCPVASPTASLVLACVTSVRARLSMCASSGAIRELASLEGPAALVMTALLPPAALVVGVV